MGVWAALASLSLMAPRRCDESALVANARALLTNRFDVELGAVAPGSSTQVGFQYLKTADALLAAQAVAHDDFDRAADQFRRIVSHQHHDGGLPLLVYGPSVDAASRWIDSDKTFFPGPAFWHQVNDSSASTGDGSSASASTSASDRDDRNASKSDSRFSTASLLAPPIASDVALQMYRLSPYETAMGVVAHTTDAVEFLCDVYPTLRKFQRHLFQSRQRSNETALLAAHHPWETFSPFSSHWRQPLDRIKSLPGYDQLAQEIPSSAKSRFAKGAVLEKGHVGADAVTGFYEPMMFLASCYDGSSQLKDDSDGLACRLNVYDVEFNALALRSAEAFVDICRVLADRSSTCPSFNFKVHDVLDDLERATQQAASLREAIVGNASRLWNETAQIFNDQVSVSNAAQSIAELPSLRGVMPAYAVRLGEEKMMGILSHFLRSSDMFQFLGARHPTSFFPFGTVPSENATTLLPYNYYLQRAFTKNDFPGLSMYVRNSTRNLVCESNTGNSTALAFLSDSGKPIDTFEDGFTESSLAAALLINILLPAVTSPPSPDTIPIDHRMLTVIMCVELVVAFLVAIGCVFLSVYFVVNRPRGRRPPRSVTDSVRVKKRREARSHRSESAGAVSSSNESQSSYGSSMDLEEGLLSEDEDSVYGSFNNRQGGAPSEAETPGGAWQIMKDALASISPW